MRMSEVIFKLDCEVTYESGKGVEVRLKHGGLLSGEVTRHLVQASRELSLAFEHLAKVEEEQPKEKVREKIEIEEA